MNIRNGIILTVLTVPLLSACGRDEAASSPALTAPALTAATLGEQDILSTAEYLARAPYADADQDNGRAKAQLCRACHALEGGGVHMIGPNLYGFFGTRAGTRDGFDYSKSMQDANFSWTPDALDAWLKNPGRFLPGNRMSFVGVSYAGDRADLIAYLLVATDRDNR